jgi:beta-catenin-like protein 1
VDAPERFIDSEVDLHEEVKRLGTLAAAPELYPELVRLGAVPSLLALLVHDNADIAAEGALLLRELTDADAVQESDAALAGGAALAEALCGDGSSGAGGADDAAQGVPGGGLPAIVAALGRFDERVAEEAAAVQSLLSVFENLVEISPTLRDKMLGPDTGLLRWLLTRLTAKSAAVDAVKVYAAELLTVLLSGSDAAAAALGDGGGVDALLRAIAPFKARGGPKDKDKGKDADGADKELVRHTH